MGHLKAAHLTDEESFVFESGDLGRLYLCLLQVQEAMLAASGHDRRQLRKKQKAMDEMIGSISPSNSRASSPVKESPADELVTTASSATHLAADASSPVVDGVVESVLEGMVSGFNVLEHSPQNTSPVPAVLSSVKADQTSEQTKKKTKWLDCLSAPVEQNPEDEQMDSSAAVPLHPPAPASQPPAPPLPKQPKAAGSLSGRRSQVPPPPVKIQSGALLKKRLANAGIITAPQEEPASQ